MQHLHCILYARRIAVLLKVIAPESDLIHTSVKNSRWRPWCLTHRNYHTVRHLQLIFCFQLHFTTPLNQRCSGQTTRPQPVSPSQNEIRPVASRWPYLLVPAKVSHWWAVSTHVTSWCCCPRATSQSSMNPVNPFTFREFAAFEVCKLMIFWIVWI